MSEQPPEEIDIESMEKRTGARFMRQSLKDNDEDTEQDSESNSTDLSKESNLMNDSEDMPDNVKKMVKRSKVVNPAVAMALRETDTFIEPRASLGSPQQLGPLQAWEPVPNTTELMPGQWVRFAQTFSKDIDEETIKSIFSMFTNIREETSISFLDITRKRIIIELQIKDNLTGTASIGDMSRNLTTITEEISGNLEQNDVAVSTQAMTIGLDDSTIIPIAVAGAGIVGASWLGATVISG